MTLRRFALLPLIAMVLASCGNLQNAEKMASAGYDQASAKVVEAQQPRPAAASDMIHVRDGVWIGSNGFRVQTGEPLPSGFERITLASQRPMTIYEVASEITRITKIQATVDDGEGTSPAGSAASASPTAPASRPGQGTPIPAPRTGVASVQLPPLPGSLQPPASQPAPQAEPAEGFGIGDRHQIAFQGSLSNLLDMVASRYGYSREFKGGEIRFARTITRVFTLLALPSESSLSGKLSSGSTGGSASGGGGQGGSASSGSSANVLQTVTAEVKLKLWEEVAAGVRSVLPAGAAVALAPSAGTITVTTTAVAMRRAESYIRAQNDNLARQVAISVQLYSVELNTSDEYGIDLSTVFQTSAQSVTLAGPAGAIANGAGSLGFKALTGSFRDSEAIFRALSSKGQVSLVTSASVTTTNNEPAPLQNIREKGYLKKVSISQNQSTSVSSLDPGSITTGFVLGFLPRILQDNRILLQVEVQLSAQNGDFKRETSGGSSIQLPDVDTRGFLQKVIMRSKESLVLAGFEQVEARRDKSGVLSADNPLFGGTSKGATRRTILVLVISPVVLSEPAGDPTVATK